MNNSFRENNKNGVVFFTSDIIKTNHGFSTRKGGVSTLPHLAEMNLGKTLGDTPENVKENYNRMAKAIGFDAESIVYTNQIHSNIVQTVTKANCNQTYDCDGFVTSEKGVTLAVRTADCVPILFCDDSAGVIGAIHAGWRGTVNGIQQNAVYAMTGLGASPEKIKVAIGACIHACCYEVGEDFIAALNEKLGKESTCRHTVTVDGKKHFNLLSLNLKMLEKVGINPENIDFSPDCTCCKPELYFSHRASKGKRGVMSAFITL